MFRISSLYFIYIFQYKHGRSYFLSSTQLTGIPARLARPVRRRKPLRVPQIQLLKNDQNSKTPKNNRFGKAKARYQEFEKAFKVSFYIFYKIL